MGNERLDPGVTCLDGANGPVEFLEVVFNRTSEAGSISLTKGSSVPSQLQCIESKPGVFEGAGKMSLEEVVDETVQVDDSWAPVVSFSHRPHQRRSQLPDTFGRHLQRSLFETIELVRDKLQTTLTHPLAVCRRTHDETMAASLPLGKDGAARGLGNLGPSSKALMEPSW